MNKTPSGGNGIRPAVVVVIAVVCLAVGAGIGVFGYLQAFSGSGQASGNTPPPVPTVGLGDTDTPAPATDVPATKAPTEAPAATSEAASEATAETASVSGGALTITKGLYKIDSAQSEVRFTLDEDLRGNRNTVIGKTNEITGDIVVDFSNPSASELSGVTINSRTLKTDDNFRNQALRSQILRSADDAFEFITFTPTSMSDLPSAAVTEAGSSYTFKVTGDLHIIEITKPATFEVTVKIDSQNQISGTARTTVKRSDFNLNIPNVPGVANVDDEVLLEIDFVAPLAESR